MSFINAPHTSLAPADVYSQDWTAASLPGNTAAGSYGTTIAYVAAGKLMTGQPFSLTAPATITIKPDASGVFTVTNSGTQALTVHEQLGRYTLKTLHYPAASHATLTAAGQPWVIVTPATFTLKPGQHEAVRISDHVPAGVRGDHYINAVWTARPAHASAGNLHLTGAVATTVTVPEPGVATAVTTHGLPVAPVVHGHDGAVLGLAVIAGTALLLVAACTAVALLLRRRYRPARAI